MSKIKLLHFHLPKTGGSALRSFFVEHEGDKAVTPPLQGMMLREALLQWQHAAVISGHFIAKQAETIPSDRMAITVLRDPIDRFLSEYFYNKFDVDNQLVDARQRASDLDTHIEYLSQDTPDINLTQMEMLYPLGTEAQTRLTADEKLASSIAALDCFALIGIQEEMSDLCSMLCARFGWPSTEARQVNVTSRRPHRDLLTTTQLRAIEKALEPEIELYSHARLRFQKDRRNFITIPCPDRDRHANSSVSTDKDVQKSFSAVPPPAVFGDMRCEISRIEVIGRVSGLGQAMTGETVDILFHIIAHEALDQVTIGIALRDEQGSLVFGTNSTLLGDSYSLTQGMYLVKFSFLNRLGPGNYTLDGALTRSLSHYDGCFHWRNAAATLNVHAYATQHFEGRVLLDVDLKIDTASPDANWCHKVPTKGNVIARAFGNTSKALSDFRCSLDVMSPIDFVGRDSDVILQVKITNCGNETWTSGGRLPVRISYRWLSKDGTIIVMDGMRSELPCDIAPGGSAVTLLHIRTTSEPGEMYLMASLVQEQVAWFVDQDHTNCRILPITVT